MYGSPVRIYSVVKERARDCRKNNTSSLAPMLHRVFSLSSDDFFKVLKTRQLSNFNESDARSANSRSRIIIIEQHLQQMRESVAEPPPRKD